MGTKVGNETTIDALLLQGRLLWLARLRLISPSEADTKYTGEGATEPTIPRQYTGQRE